jgi:hypothetical protein
MNTILLFSLSLISVSSKAPWGKYVARLRWLISLASVAHVQSPSAYRSTRVPQPTGVSAYKMHMRAVSGYAHVPEVRIVLGHDLARARPAVSGHGLIRWTTTADDRNGA